MVVHIVAGPFKPDRRGRNVLAGLSGRVARRNCSAVCSCFHIKRPMRITPSGPQSRFRFSIINSQCLSIPRLPHIHPSHAQHYVFFFDCRTSPSAARFSRAAKSGPGGNARRDGTALRGWQRPENLSDRTRDGISSNIVRTSILV